MKTEFQADATNRQIEAIAASPQTPDRRVEVVPIPDGKSNCICLLAAHPCAILPQDLLNGVGQVTLRRPAPVVAAEIKNSETDDFVGCIGTVRVLFMG